MILTAIGIYFNVDRQFQSYVLDKFPQYGAGLTAIEDNEAVQSQLEDVGGGDTGFESGKPMFEESSVKGPLAPELIPGGEWFNLDPGQESLSLQKLRGKVVVIDFWTYTCINCIRTIPYLNDWYDTYRDDGLVIIGVHTPEFEFEKDPANLQQAIDDYELKHPIVQDNNYETWRAYNNRYWPAKYIIDKDGYIRYTHFGEGAYDETEEVIQDLLAETGVEVSESGTNPDYEIYSRTPETYLGYLRLRNFGSPESIVKDGISTYTLPERLSRNEVAYGGEWDVMGEYANPQQGAELKLNFEAKEVFLVMRSKDGPAEVDVYVDGEKQYFGDDNNQGVVDVEEDRLYRLVDLPEPGEHELRLVFPDSNTELYAFTFG
jgi:thiol-disulfide isomerase/thioredoxin